MAQAPRLSIRTLTALSLLGFSAGLPNALTGITLSMWLTAAQVDVTQIGYLGAVWAPYALKFLWAPLLDRFSLPLFGRRRGWILLAQLLLIVTLSTLGSCDPATDLPWLALLALATAFISATQDIVIDAHRTDVCGVEQAVPGTAGYISGYRIALLLARTGAPLAVGLLLWPWAAVYQLLALTIGLGLVGTLLAPEAAPQPAATLRQTVIEPLRAFRRDHQPRQLLTIAIFISLFRFGDFLVAQWNAVFLLHLGFTNTEVGWMNALGLGTGIIGAIGGSLLLQRLGRDRGLWLAAGLQAASNLGYLMLALSGKSWATMTAVVVIENLCGGLGTAAFLAFLLSLCSPAWSGTQFALLSSLMQLLPIAVGAFTGAAVKHYGWPGFFAISVLAAAPSILLLPTFAPWTRSRPLESR